MSWLRKIFERFWALLYDRCEWCHGRMGGIRGNENVVNGRILCDYCHAKLNEWPGRADA